jgi:hypothetical protein
VTPRSAAVAILWQAMVVRAEAMHDLVVAGQRRENVRVAGRILRLSQELATLAAAAQLLRGRTGSAP